MKPHDFIPSKEADLVTWSNQFSSLLTAGTGDNYGLSALQTAQFENLNTTWVDLYALANGGNTRTPQVITDKDDAKDAMVAKAREFAAIIQANPAVNDGEKQALGLTVRDPEPSPKPVPQTPPNISFMAASGTYIKFRLRDGDEPTNRGKPKNVVGAALLVAFGPQAPDLSDESAWTWKGNVTRTINVIDFAGQPSGTTAWITALWFNAKGETGEPAQPFSVQIPGQAGVTLQNSNNLQFPGEDELSEAA